MKQSILLLSLLSFLIIPSVAQVSGDEELKGKLGIQAGYSMVTLAPNYEQGGEPKFKMKPGFHAGLLADLPLSGGDLTFQIGAIFSSKGASSDEDDLQGGDFVNTVLNYIDVPMNFKVTIAEVVDLYIGGYLSFNVGGRVTSNINGVETEVTVVPKERKVDFTEIGAGTTPVRYVDYGANFGLGYSFSPSIGISAMYSLGIANINNTITTGRSIIIDADPFKVSNRVLSISLMYFF